MITYANLEVDQDGHILQSSYRVPSHGVLPKPMNTQPEPLKARAYTEGLFTPAVEVAFEGPPETLRIKALYFPPPVRGWAALKLLAPITLLAAAIFVVFHLLDISTLTPVRESVVFVVFTGVFYFMVGYPCVRWIRHIYFQGNPTARVQRRVAANYPDIPILHDLDAFKVAAHLKE